MPDSDTTEDKFAIIHNIQEVARAFDEKLHHELLPQVFTDNASVLYRLRGQRIDFSMPDGAAKVKYFHDLCYWTQHLVSPQIISIDGDQASARTPVHALHLQVRNDGTHNQWVIGAVYHDELVRQDEHWRIAKRVALCPYVEGDFLTDGVKSFPSLPDLDHDAT
jgi:hypothetical protein